MSPMTANVKGLRPWLVRPLPSAGTVAAPETDTPTTRTAAAVRVRRRIDAPGNGSRPADAGRPGSYAGALTCTWRADEHSGQRPRRRGTIARNARCRHRATGVAGRARG